MKRFYRHTILLVSSLLLLVCWASPAFAQVGLNLSSAHGITVEIDYNVLDFGQIATDGDRVDIEQEDSRSVVVSIEGIANRDVDVYMYTERSTYPNNFLFLDLGSGDYDENNKLSAEFFMAFYNRVPPNKEEEDFGTVRGSAIPISGDMATFQIQRRTQGPPGPPPTPNHEGYQPDVAKAYIVIYGNLQPAQVNAGKYSETITIHVEYADHFSD